MALDIRLAKGDPLQITHPHDAAPDAPPPVLLACQRDWVADEAQLKLGQKGRRVGLTWAEASDAALQAAAAGGSNYFYISATQDMAREFIEAVAMWARAYDYAASEIGEGIWDDGADVDPDKRHIKTYEVVFPTTGRRVLALSSRPTNLRGKQGVIGIDEAAFAPDLKALIKAAMAMLLWGDKVRIWSTHDGVENPFNELIQEVLAGKRGGPADASVHTIPFRLAVEQGLYKRVCLRRGKVWTQADEDEWVAKAYKFYGTDAAEELDVIPSNSSGAYLSLALIESRSTSAPWPVGPLIVRGVWDDAFAFGTSEEVRRYAIDGWLREHIDPMIAGLNKQRRHVFGLDFGRSSNLTVLTILEEDVNLARRERAQVELANCPFSCQEQIARYVIQRLPRWRGGVADAGGNGAALAEKLAQEFGVSMVEQLKLSEGFYALRMPRFKAHLEDGTLTDIPRDEFTRDDLRAIRVERGIPKVRTEDTKTAGSRALAAEAGEKGKRHGDAAVALFLADYAFDREAGEIAFDAAPARNSRWDGPGRDDDDWTDFGSKGGW